MQMNWSQQVTKNIDNDRVIPVRVQKALNLLQEKLLHIATEELHANSPTIQDLKKPLLNERDIENLLYHAAHDLVNASMARKTVRLQKEEIKRLQERIKELEVKIESAVGNSFYKEVLNEKNI